jgi:hypothetical protein
LCYNPNAIELLNNNINILIELSDNNSIPSLSSNPNAISILKKHQNFIQWYSFSENPSIFKYDYEMMKNNNLEFKEEIIAAALHPKRIFNLISKYGEDEIYDIYFDD